MLSKLDKELAFVQQALNLRARRQEVLAANLANADTPHYKARDVDFAAALRRASTSVGGAVQLARTAPEHLSARGGADALMSGLIRYRAALQPSLDGNTVDLNVERAHFAENTMQYQFLLERASGAFRTIKQAIAPAS